MITSLPVDILIWLTALLTSNRFTDNWFVTSQPYLGGMSQLLYFVYWMNNHSKLTFLLPISRTIQKIRIYCQVYL